MHITALRQLCDTAGTCGALPPLPRTRLFGIELVNCRRAPAIDHIMELLAARIPTRAAFLNAHCVNIMERDADYAAALRSADLVLPDGAGIAAALRMRGRHLLANLNGTDLIPELCRRLAEENRSVFLLGGRPGVAEAAGFALRQAAPGLEIAGTQDGYFTPAREDEIIARINASGADVVLVAMGVPLQELWLARHAGRLRAPLCAGVGGLFDFLSGRIPRAPAALRRTGLEWTYRLYQEPARMWRRYILGNPEFLCRAARDAAREAALPRRADLAAKRAMDVAGAALGLVMLAPILLAVALAVRLTSRGPALLRQTRVGRGGRRFTLYKFRSMYIDAEARRAALLRENQHGTDGITFKMRHDPRVTRIGRLLRRSSIDELPQLINVLNGTMSLVGPRPPLPAEVARYSAAERRRLESVPGLTCLWQVSGRADLPFPRQVALDVEYQERRSLWLDVVILLRTIPAVLCARGAY